MSELDLNANIRAAWQPVAAAGWLRQVQEQALAEFDRLGFPTTRLENWKYTDISRMTAAYPDWLAHARAADAPAAAAGLDIADALQLTFVDGVFAADRSDRAGLPADVFLGSIEELGTAHPEKLQQLMGSLALPGESGMIALNAAFAGQGAALLVPAGVTLLRPVLLTYLSATPQTSTQSRLLVELGAGSKATLVEHYCSSNPVINNPVAEIHCAAQASLDYYKVQAEHPEAWHTATQIMRVDRDATLHTTHVDTGGNIARNELTVRLAGRGAHAEAKGLFMAAGRRHVESRITVEHLAPDTVSRERFRGILGDTARGVFNGRIYVHKDAQKTSAELTNRNLLLSKGAEIDTKPELEIYADDVRCAHGSTTGQLNQDSLFYLLTRGVDRAAARNMLITAFAAELLTDIAIPAIAEHAQKELHNLQAAQTGGTEP